MNSIENCALLRGRIEQIVYLGPAGSFSEICAQRFTSLVGSLRLVSAITLNDIAVFLSEHSNSCGLFPVENSLGGTVNESLDSILKLHDRFVVCAELVLRIEHNILSRGDISQLQELRAHSQAFAQCADYLRKNLPNASQIIYPSNSAACASLAALAEPDLFTHAALGSREAANIYGLQILAANINDSEHNYTRFWLIADADSSVNAACCNLLTSIVFRIPRDEPGGLMRILAVLADRKLNLTKIESRPFKGSYYEYIFLLDFVSTSRDRSKEAVEAIKGLVSEFRLLGTYPVLNEADLRFDSGKSQH